MFENLAKKNYLKEIVYKISALILHQCYSLFAAMFYKSVVWQLDHFVRQQLKLYVHQEHFSVL